MRKFITLTIAYSIILILSSCNGEDSITKEESILNKGTTLVKNGKGITDTIIFECVGCSENIRDKKLFDKLIEKASALTKESLNYPLSFMPKNISITLIQEDSLRYFENNEIIDNVFLVLFNYGYIAKNGFGNELEGEATNSFYLHNKKVADLEDKIKLEDLEFKDELINRSLIGYERNSDFIEVMPLLKGAVIVNSSLDCVDEGATFTITLEDESEITLNSWNDFNCEGKSYFDKFNREQLNQLKSSRIKYLYIYSEGKSIMTEVAENESNYFQQLSTIYESL